MSPRARAIAPRVRQYRYRCWACAIPAASFERLQIRKRFGQLLRGQKFIGHEIARLDVLRILYPAGEIPGIIYEGVRGERSAAHQMSEIGRTDGTGLSPPDSMAQAAAVLDQRQAAGFIR